MDGLRGIYTKHTCIHIYIIVDRDIHAFMSSACCFVIIGGYKTVSLPFSF